MLTKIIQSISIKLNAVFGDTHKVHAESIEQGLEAPCFFILPMQLEQVHILWNRYKRIQPFDIHYFPVTNTKTECYDMAEQLVEALEEVQFDAGPIRGRRMKWEVIDGVLHFFVNFDFYALKLIVPDLMGTVDITTDLKE